MSAQLQTVAPATPTCTEDACTNPRASQKTLDALSVLGLTSTRCEDHTLALLRSYIKEAA